MNEEISFSINDILRRGMALLTGRIKWLFLLAVSAPLLNWLAQGLFTGFSATGGEMPLGQGLGVLSAALLSGLLGLVTMAAVILSAADHTLPAGESLKLAFKRLPRLLLMSVFFLAVSLAALIFAVMAVWPMISMLTDQEASGVLAALFGLTVVGFILIVAMAVFYIYFVMFPYLLVLTDEPFFEAIKTSCVLVRGRFWKITGVVLVLGLISMGISMVGMILTFLVALLSLFIFPQWGQALASLAMIPVVAAATVFTQTTLLALYFTITRQMPKLNIPSLEAEPGQTI